MNKIILTKKIIKNILPVRRPDTNKSDYGRVLILAGSRNMIGAGVLSANSCIKSGAGLVTLGIPLSQQNIVVKHLLPEIMTLGLKETSSGTLSINSYQKIIQFIIDRKIDVVAIGPGLSTNTETKKLIKKIVLNLNLPLVIDADAINSLADNVSVLQNKNSNIVITPHPGELSRLINIPVSEIEKNRSEIAKKFADKYNLICVLKGYRTVITDGEKVFINTTGNPGMATAGSGDVLTGMIAGFIGQIKNILNAVIVSVYIHGLAGDLASKDKTQIGMIASDIISKISDAIKRVLE
jgi:NAD(P)H-hydrate epimerase